MPTGFMIPEYGGAQRGNWDDIPRAWAEHFRRMETDKEYRQAVLDACEAVDRERSQCR